MKKLFLTCLIAAGTMCMANAQSNLQNILSNVLNQGAAAATSSTDDSSSSKTSTAKSLISNLISSVTGSVTTTQANLIGTWTYSEPCVQFESDNLLQAAGGSAAATKVETKLATMYKMVGITAGKVTFTFANDGTVEYTLNGKKMSGTYTFDSSAKTVTINPSAKSTKGVKAYVTISGNQMSLCFDSTKVLELFSTYGSALGSSASTIATLAGSYKGMKTGFKFKK